MRRANGLASKGIVAFRNMNNQPANVLFLAAIATPSMLDSCELRLLQTRICGKLRDMLSTCVVLLILLLPAAVAQQASPKHLGGATIRGTVLSLDGKPVNEAIVSLEKKNSPGAEEAKTNAAGAFTFTSLSRGNYRLSAGKSGSRSPTIDVIASSEKDMEKVDLVLQVPGLASNSDTPSASTAQAMEFADQPKFTVAGVTDWTAVGGHGSDSTLRTSESLASETATLKPESAGRGTATARGGTSEEEKRLLADQQSADLHRSAGESDEKSGDPLSAVHEYEQAVELDSSEQNYFKWGTELLLHRAVWQAQEVFHKGVSAYPKSARMHIALGTAFFAGARYDEAALSLCTASDLNLSDPNPYIFMGKIQMAAPNPLACVEPKLARFVQQQPGSSIANYLYAMSILKHQGQLPDKQAVQQAEILLTKAVTIDSKCSDAYLQLGIISASQRHFDEAIDFYKKAIEADPQLADAHYRLGVAYDRIGQSAKAKQEFQLHDEIKQQQTDATERQRREVQQFLVVQPGGTVSPVFK